LSAYLATRLNKPNRSKVTKSLELVFRMTEENDRIHHTIRWYMNG